MIGLFDTPKCAGDANDVLIEDGIFWSVGGAGAVGVATGELCTEV